MQRARLVAILSMLVIGGMLSSSWMSVATAAPQSALQAGGDPTVDLASLAIYPFDTGEDDYILVDGRSCLSPETCATPVFFGAETKESLTDAGLVRAYALALAKLTPEKTFPATRSLATTIAEYRDDASAETGLSTFLSWLSDPNSEVSDPPAIGDGAQLFDIPDGLPTDKSTGVVGLRFRVGSMIVGIEIRDYNGDAVDRAQVESLGQEVADRISQAEGSTVGSLALHHRAASSDYYADLDGTSVPLYRESDDQFKARTDEFSSAGVDNVFISNQALVTGDDPNSPAVVLYITLYQFPSSSEASNYLFDASNGFATLRERNGATTEEPEEPPAVGDESVWFLNVYSDGYQAMGFVRSGEIVARIIWQKNQTVEAGQERDLVDKAATDLLPGATYTAQEQVKCIRNGGCPGLTRLSSRLLP